MKHINVRLFWNRVKNRDRKDKRVELLQKFARTHFPCVKYMEYAVEVEAYTLSKAKNLILNVDGAIGSIFLDLFAGSGMFSEQEIDEIVEIGYLNGFFVLARSIGLIGWVFTLTIIHSFFMWTSVLGHYCSFWTFVASLSHALICLLWINRTQNLIHLPTKLMQHGFFS